MMERPVPDSVSAVQNFTNATRDVESDLETGQEGKIREIVMDNNDAEPKVSIIVFTIVNPSNHERPCGIFTNFLYANLNGFLFFKFFFFFLLWVL